ncbi:MAG: PQQ-binding-like beta-propeller repeat protein [Pirellulaceae bacterium]|nr:PQQ-binding-like beta-propeller repeat protein [Pirellulaceae bacterium]
MYRISILATGMLWLVAHVGDPGRVCAEDWPTYRHDQRRSGATVEQVDASRLTVAWQWQSPLPPAPAWPDAARWDAYALVDGMKSMRNYDPVFHPVVVGRRVYLPSNTDDTLRCLNLDSGQELWQYTVDAPIRIAPTVYQSSVYFGADDGCVYALEAETGRLRWQAHAGQTQQCFLNDGRVCSFEPVRSGVLIDSQAGCGIVSAGMFPWEVTRIVALNLSDGSIVWQRDLGTGWSLEGAMLLSNDHIIAPQGRSAPQLLTRTAGESLGPLEGGGGSFVLLTDDDAVLHGPGNKEGWITQSQVGNRQRIATFERGTAMVVDQNRSYLLDDLRLSAMERHTNTVLWSAECPQSSELVRAGQTLFVGGVDVVRAFDATTGALLWRHSVQGRALGLIVANGYLLASTDAGIIYAFAPTGSPQQHDLPGNVPENQQAFSFLQPAPLPVVDQDAGLLSRWVFHANRLISYGKDNKRRAVKSLLQGATQSQESAPSEKYIAPLPEKFRFAQAGREQALLLDGRTDSVIATSHRRIAHPTQAVTAAAWVRIDRPAEIGGIVSMLDQEGQYPQGWLLGFRNQQFCFALSTKDGAEPLTWVQSDADKMTIGGWSLVVGTYDGQTARLYVDQRLVASSTQQRGPIVYPTRAAYRIGAYGTRQDLQRMEGMINEVRVYDRAVSQAEIATLYAEKAERFPQPASEAELTERSKYVGEVASGLAAGPILEFTAPQTATVRWWTHHSQPSVIQLQEHPYAKTTVRVTSAQQPTNEHTAEIQNVRHHELIKYRIGQNALEQATDDRPHLTGYYECDGHFDFQRATLPDSDLGLNLLQAARSAIAMTGHTEPRGLAIVVGAHDEARFAEAVCRQSGLDVIVLDADQQRVAAARSRLLRVGVYGRPVSVRHVSDFASLALPNRTADFLMVAPVGSDLAAPNELSSQLGSVSLSQLALKVQPRGSLVLPAALVTAELLLADDSGRSLERKDAKPSDKSLAHPWTTLLVPQRSGAADWSHMYGSPDNSAFAGEMLAGASRQADLKLVWAGRPGPRYQSDRGNRKPSPLAAGGRLFLQGLRRVIAVDAFNGTIQWGLELPEVIRFNVPRDCGNWCADSQHLYIAARSRCMVVDAASGAIATQLNVYDPRQQQLQWGFIARHERFLIGSSVVPGAAFTEFWGGENWYDEKFGEHTKKVCSDALFAMEPESGQLIWTYDDGLIVNPTITIADGCIYFLTCRDQQLKQRSDRRLNDDAFWANLHLVALDAQSGSTLWDVPAQPIDGRIAVYLASSAGKLVLVTSKDGAFSAYALDAASGKQLWRGQYTWEADHHGKHLSRPAIVDGQIYLRPLTLDLHTGKVLSEAFPKGHQCGSYSASRYAMFLRAGELAIWDRTTGQSDRWQRVRPDCWISTIPAQGMLLSPEGGGGCSCGGWIETSMAFGPTIEQELGWPPPREDTAKP